MSETAAEQSIFGDMSDLEKTLSQDFTGDKVRAMVEYFQGIVEATQRMLPNAREANQRHLINQLLSGFEAAERVVRQIWETIHGAVLVM